jgi:hypothetical protein
MELRKFEVKKILLLSSLVLVSSIVYSKPLQTNVLHYYTELQDTKNITETINNSDLNLREFDENGNSYLHIISNKGKKRSLMLLAPYYNKVTINNLNAHNQTAIYLASKNKMHEIAHMLIENGANPNIQDSEGLDAFSFASKYKDDLMADILSNFNKKIKNEEYIKKIEKISGKIKNLKNDLDTKIDLLMHLKYYKSIVAKRDKTIFNLEQVISDQKEMLSLNPIGDNDNLAKDFRTTKEESFYSPTRSEYEMNIINSLKATHTDNANSKFKAKRLEVSINEYEFNLSDKPYRGKNAVSVMNFLIKPLFIFKKSIN